MSQTTIRLVMAPLLGGTGWALAALGVQGGADPVVGLGAALMVYATAVFVGVSRD